MTNPFNPEDPTPTPLADRLALAGEGSTRLDGWTPDRMAAFVDALAASGCVETACAHIGMARSGLYEARRRNPLFALAWEDALIDGALPRLADELLSHAFKGSVERFYRDGELVGEKRFTDTRLGLALLKRLDRMAAERAAADRAAAEAEQVDKVDNQPFSPTLDHPHPRVTRTRHGWQTSFPPPAELAPEDLNEDEDPDLDMDLDMDDDSDVRGVEALAAGHLEAEDRWPGSPNYLRHCTAAETRLLDDWATRQLASAAAEKDLFFAALARPGADAPGTFPPRQAMPSLHAPSPRT